MAEANREADKLGVFISYSRDDIALADQLVVTLDLAGFAPTIDRVGIHGAEDWQAKLGALIREADTVVFVLSPASATSKVCAWEVEQAQAMGKRIIPVLCRPLDGAAPPPALAQLNYIFFYADPARPGSGWATGMRELDRALRTDLGWLREHTRLLQRALEWQSGGQAPGRLLVGDDIREARAWVARQPREAPAPTALHLDFLAASEAHETAQAGERERALAERERLVAEAEASRTAREAAQAAALAAAERERRQAVTTARRTALGLAVASALALVASGAGWWAFEKQKEAVANLTLAEEQRKLAESQSKAAANAVEVVKLLAEQTLQAAGPSSTTEQRSRQFFHSLEHAVEGGNLPAMRLAGFLAYNGQGTSKDFNRARELWEKAANGGDPGAMRNLGFLYSRGEGVPRDYMKAIEWFNNAATRGDATAMHFIGTFYEGGHGVSQDYAKAREWYEKAAAAGDAVGARSVGWLYQNGHGVSQDYDSARKWYEMAAASGNLITPMSPPFRHEGLSWSANRRVDGDEDGAQQGAVPEGTEHGGIQPALRNRGCLS